MALKRRRVFATSGSAPKASNILHKHVRREAGGGMQCGAHLEQTFLGLAALPAPVHCEVVRRSKLLGKGVCTNPNLPIYLDALQQMIDGSLPVARSEHEAR